MNIQKELKVLENVIEKMKEKLFQLESKIEKREDFFNDKSDKWQESEKGEAYNEVTEDLQDKYNDIEFEIDQLESSLNTLKDLTE